jgi:hypothetical protein
MAVFRWDPPTYSNGIIEGYKVKYWYSSHGTHHHISDSLNLNATKMEFNAFKLSRNSTYYFQVRALQISFFNHTKPTLVHFYVDTSVFALVCVTDG